MRETRSVEKSPPLVLLSQSLSQVCGNIEGGARPKYIFKKATFTQIYISSDCCALDY